MDPFIGQIMIVGFNFAPIGWANCNGQLLAIASNTALFSLLGTTYGGVTACRTAAHYSTDTRTYTHCSTDTRAHSNEHCLPRNLRI